MKNGLTRKQMQAIFIERSKEHVGNFAGQMQAGNESPDLANILATWREKIPTVNIETLSIIFSTAFAILDIIALNNSLLGAADSSKQS